MYLKEKTVTGYVSNQVAYPVGEFKEAYNICSFFCQDVETNEVTTNHEVIKNLSYNERPKDKPPAVGKYRETLFTGTYKECEQFIIDIVEKEGEWIYDSKMNYVHPLYK